ncbi:thiamine phosphate synthase [Ornithinibacillus sp. 179-J 7C1 HS]|uniref:thiamine phosphate synthase n=1 Tax=Ornithinibacillus sp. 179-J 7C1 HS TaxID=3142384 RepID=UPI0039A2B108
MMNKQLLRKYFIMGSQNCSKDPVRILEEALEAGITAFQFREKGIGSLQGKEKVELGKKLREVCKRYQTPFILNDDIELADILEVDGLHVGQDDQPVEKIRKAYPDLMIGLSISNQEELQRSPIHLVDYIGAGPIFPTTTKTDAKKAVGVKWIQTLRNQYPHLPIVGIGGIQIDNANSVMEAGADGVAVISAITEATDIKVSVEKL